MTFTRLSDSSTLSPLIMGFPFEQRRSTGNVIRRVAQSSEVRVTYLDSVGPREGTFSIFFETYTEAFSASEFFSDRSLYEFDGVDPAATSEYSIIGGYIVETADAGTGDLALVFGVSDVMNIVQKSDVAWELRVPYMEVPE